MDDFEILKEWRNNIPDIYNGKFRRTWDKAITKQSMRAAIDSKCADCMCWQNSEIKQCDIVTCPLWQYRPLQDKDSNREKTVREFVSEIARTPVGGSLTK